MATRGDFHMATDTQSAARPRQLSLTMIELIGALTAHSVGVIAVARISDHGCRQAPQSPRARRRRASSRRDPQRISRVATRRARLRTSAPAAERAPRIRTSCHLASAGGALVVAVPRPGTRLSLDPPMILAW